MILNKGVMVTLEECIEIDGVVKKKDWNKVKDIFISIFDLDIQHLNEKVVLSKCKYQAITKEKNIMEIKHRLRNGSTTYNIHKVFNARRTIMYLEEVKTYES